MFASPSHGICVFNSYKGHFSLAFSSVLQKAGFLMSRQLWEHTFRALLEYTGVYLISSRDPLHALRIKDIVGDTAIL